VLDLSSPCLENVLQIALSLIDNHLVWCPLYDLGVYYRIRFLNRSPLFPSVLRYVAIASFVEDAAVLFHTHCLLC
jgi:hypothetical protein